MRTNCRRCLPCRHRRLWRPSVFVLISNDVIFLKIPCRYFQYLESCAGISRKPVFCTNGYEKLGTLRSGRRDAIDFHRASPAYHMPKFSPLLMALQAQRLARIDDDDLYGAFRILRKPPKMAPRPILLIRFLNGHEICCHMKKVYHSESAASVEPALYELCRFSRIGN